MSVGMEGSQARSLGRVAFSARARVKTQAYCKSKVGKWSFETRIRMCVWVLGGWPVHGACHGQGASPVSAALLTTPISYFTLESYIYHNMRTSVACEPEVDITGRTSRRLQTLQLKFAHGCNCYSGSKMCSSTSGIWFSTGVCSVKSRASPLSTATLLAETARSVLRLVWKGKCQSSPIWVSRSTT